MGLKMIVAGSSLPRSEMSIMMNMLEASGKTIVLNNLREADANNPKGFYEFERVK